MDVRRHAVQQAPLPGTNDTVAVSDERLHKFEVELASNHRRCNGISWMFADLLPEAWNRASHHISRTRFEGGVPEARLPVSGGKKPSSDKA